MKDAYYVLLKNGLSELKYSEYLHIPHEEKIDHTFSEKYLTFKNKLLKKTGQYYWKYVNTLTKKIAVIFLIIFPQYRIIGLVQWINLVYNICIISIFSQIVNAGGGTIEKTGLDFDCRNRRIFLPAPGRFSWKKFQQILY